MCAKELALEEIGERIKNGSSCLDVQGPSDSQYLDGKGEPANFSAAQIFACNSSLNQKWNLSGQIRYGNKRSLCLSRAGKKDGNGTPLIVSSCGIQATIGKLWNYKSTAGQIWDYYF